MGGVKIEALKALRGVGCKEGVSPSPLGEGAVGRGLCPLPEKFCIFCIKITRL